MLDRSAKAQCCVAYWDGSEPHFFFGETAGEILVEPRGEQGFGWDAWFRPADSKKTYAEMSDEEKDRVSHRGKAYRQLAQHLRGEMPHGSDRGDLKTGQQP
jgi:XTP/dITP diphosphohydrolase